MQIEWAHYRVDPRYVISSVGEVYSLIKNRLLFPFVVGNYLKIEISGRQRFIHNLVAEVFIGPRPPGLIVRHLDGDSFNNDKMNLDYGTSTQNVQDSRDHGTFRKLVGTECKQSKLTKEQIKTIRIIYASGEFSQQYLARLFKLSQPRICDIVNRCSYKDVG